MDLDSLPFPDFSLVHKMENVSLTPIQTSRGCPYNCDFCSVTPMFGRKYRFRSTDNIIEELKRHKNKGVFFYDDHFFANKERTKELLERMIKENIRPEWVAQARVEISKDDELLSLMRKSNCFSLCFGFESLDQNKLERYNKRQTVNDIFECIRKVHKHKIRVHGMFIADDFTDEKNLDARAKSIVKSGIIDYHKLGIDTLQNSILVPLPGTPLFDKIVRENRFIKNPLEDYNHWSLFDGGHCVFWPERISPESLQEKVQKEYQLFYSKKRITSLLIKSIFNWHTIPTFYFRQLGHRIIKKWVSNNTKYLNELKSISKIRSISSESGQ